MKESTNQDLISLINIILIRLFVNSQVVSRSNWGLDSLEILIQHFQATQFVHAPIVFNLKCSFRLSIKANSRTFEHVDLCNI